MNTARIIDYFVALSRASRSLLDRLPIPLTVEPLAQIMASLRPALSAERENALQTFTNIGRPDAAVPQTDSPPPGMNTVGILTDRLTILLIKEWCLRHKVAKPDAADKIFDVQTMEIIRVIANTTPGIAALLEKVSTIDANANAATWEQAYFGLLSANLLMWETQEILYRGNISELPGEELRDYIRFFSQANMERNAYISQCESLYWSA